MFSLWLYRMRQAGLQGNTPREVLEEALKIRTVAACEQAIIGSLTAMSELKRIHPEDAATIAKFQLEFMKLPEVAAVRLLWRQIMHEGI